MSIVFRRGVPADAGALARIAAQTFRDTFAAENTAADMDAHIARAFNTQQQGRELADPAVRNVLGYIGDSLAAYAQVRKGPAPTCVKGVAPVELWRFYVARAWHGQGIARYLMQQVHDEARQLGARTIWLGVWERNARAIAYYRKAGYVDVGSHVFVLGTDAQTDRIMVCDVSGE
jgi:ribosomal protein S18 acetylase RimI-like enzyme